LIGQRVRIFAQASIYHSNDQFPEGMHFGWVADVYEWDEGKFLHIHLEQDTAIGPRTYKSVTVNWHEVIVE
jgi:hypothetical protein